jgi:hypothetical protein
MHIELDPSVGITGFPFGMPAAEVKEAGAALGRIQVQNEGPPSPFHHLKVLALHPQFEITLLLEDSATLTAAEIWAPRPGPETITVTFRGLDVFGTPARDLLRQIEAMGFTTDHFEVLHPIVPRLSLGFTRDAGHEVPLDTDGWPLYFQAVLVGPEDYYDETVRRRQQRANRAGQS